MTENCPTTSKLWNAYDYHFSRMGGTSNQTATGVIEVDKYLQETIINCIEDPLKWWRDHKLNIYIYPQLYELVKKLFS